MKRSFELAFTRESFLAAAERLAPQSPSRPGVAALTPFLDQYRADAYTEDFLALTTEDAATLALELWELHAAAADSPERRIRVRRALGHGGRALKIDVAEIVGPDLAFLVDSTIAAFQEAKIEIRAVLHPVLETPNGKRSLIQVHLPSLDDSQRAELEALLTAVMADVTVVNADFGPLREKMRASIAALGALRPTGERPAEDIREAQDFLDWLVRDNFTFLGARDYRLAVGPRGEILPEEPVMEEASGLGILRDPSRRVLSRAAEPAILAPQVMAFLDDPSPVIVAKASFLSRVHRRSHADYVGVKRFGPRGEVTGETRFVGLFTSDAYTRAASDVPLIRRKIARVKERWAGSGSRFSLRRLDNVLQTFPRDELFQISEDDLDRISQGVMQLQVRPRTRLFIRRDRFDRYVSALLYTPRDSFNSELRARAHRVLADAFEGRASAFYPSFGDGPLARVHFIVGLNRGHPEPDPDALDLQMRQLFETWEDALARTARASGGAGAALIPQAGFTAAYKEAFTPAEGLADLTAISAMADGRKLKARVFGDDLQPGVSRCKIYHADAQLELAEIVPVLVNMGLRVRSEVPHPVTLRGEPERVVWVHDLVIDRPAGQRRLDARFEEAFEAVWRRETENDGFNSLVVALSVDWRSAALLRTLARYRGQSGLDPSEAVQVASLRDNPEIAGEILKLFAVKFDPGMPGDVAARRLAAAPVAARINAALDAVASLDADRVLRRIAGVVKATVRTNFWQTDEASRPRRHIALKILSREADPLPAPRPLYEIFVWSPEVEGVHLRFGKVARGGLRLSDRRDDFRTEVLGLVKAQQVKNAVIVPVGAKGGFFPKQVPAGGSREQVAAANLSAYRTFVSAVLQISDNLVRGRPQRPPRVVAWDDDDPYLVVAADKGTASYSDAANQLSADHGFWLGDAFASGGSAGYDHKKMGITARGAWEAVKRHFREMNRDTQTQPFTVIGIGDMSGDVFGNGMLLSRTIRLIAAFNHMHIFIDPDPADPEASWAERKRLFELPRSSWADYDAALISPGGGVFARSAKSIPLSPALRAMTGLADEAVTPDALIRALLAAEVDLLWFGGIGTYVKASTQSHAEVGDKANDLLRVDGRDIRARVIAEGANLGVTQAGRIEYARRGGRINTDAIDNSGGVDSSDHEVNIKILLADAVASKALPAADRNPLLERMTDDVARLVLANNYAQTGALSVLEATAAADLESHERLIEVLEAQGALNRAVEGLPSPEAFRELDAKRLGLTRPELAVLLAYAKIDLFNALIAGDGPDDPAFEALLADYFPDDLRPFADARARHRLRREIIATQLSNRVVNLAGPTFAALSREAGGLDAGRIVRGFEAAWSIFRFDELTARIDALDGVVPAAAQTLMRVETAANLRLLGGALAKDSASGGASVAALVERYRDRVGEVRRVLPDVLSRIVLDRVEERANRYRQAGAPADLALDVAMVRALASARETVDIAARTRWPLAAVAQMQHRVGEATGLDRMRAAARDVQPRDHWERLAILRVADDLPRQQAELTIAAIAAAQRRAGPPAMVDREAAQRLVEEWAAPWRDTIARLAGPAGGPDAASGWSLARLVLLGDAVRELVYASRSDAPDPQNRP